MFGLFDSIADWFRGILIDGIVSSFTETSIIADLDLMLPFRNSRFFINVARSCLM